MTSNQIAYWRYVEDMRHNRAVEAEANRSNVAREQQAMREAAEVQRANRAREQATLVSNQEVQRANLAREAETKRSNMAREWETYRSNIQQERAQILNLSEVSRSNAAREKETLRANMASEAIRNAEQVAKQQNLEAQNTRLTLQNLHDAENASIARYNAAENARHNRQTESNQVYSAIGSLIGTGISSLGRLGSSLISKRR